MSIKKGVKIVFVNKCKKGYFREIYVGIFVTLNVKNCNKKGASATVAKHLMGFVRILLSLYNFSGVYISGFVVEPTHLVVGIYDTHSLKV